MENRGTHEEGQKREEEEEEEEEEDQKIRARNKM